MHYLLRPIALALFVFLAMTNCHASIEISATSSGWFRNTGANNPTNPNYVVQANSTSNLRNFFIFDLTDVTNTILSASLRLENPQAASNGSPSIYTLYDVSTNTSSLTSAQTTATDIYADLGTGTSYGSVALDSSIGVGTIEIPLSTAAIAAMNSASGLFAFGGSLTTTGTALAQLFLNTSGPEYVRTLVLEVEQPATGSTGDLVPEPLSWMVWCGLAAVSGLGRSRHRSIR